MQKLREAIIQTKRLLDNNLLALRRPPRSLGDEQFIRERVFEIAERILSNLQKGIVDNTGYILHIFIQSTYFQDLDSFFVPILSRFSLARANF